MKHHGFTEVTPFPGNAHLNRYNKVFIVKEGPERHRVTYQGSCFICGAPVTVKMMWEGTGDDIPDVVRDRFLCSDHS
jgi:hypothetical protein